MAKTKSRLIKKEEKDLKDTQLLNSIHTTTTRTSGKIPKRIAPKKQNTVKTRNYSLDLKIKEEEKEIKIEYKYSQLVNNTNDTINTKDKPIQREPSENGNSDVSISQVKSEEESDSKTLLQKTQSKKITFITQDQIERLIKYIVNDKMTVKAASRKVNISVTTGFKYYIMYKEDPEKKIPELPNKTLINKTQPTHEQIKSLIHHIESDKLSVAEASRKVKISVATGHKYYKIYKNDPEQKIPEPKKLQLKNTKPPTHNQIKQLINYITKDNMSISEASRKVNISVTTGYRYYIKYLNDPEQKIPDPRRLQLKNKKPVTYNQIKGLINYITKDNMSIAEASIKVDISAPTGYKYYKLYKKDPERKIPSPRKQPTKYAKSCTQDQINALINYIEKDKMNLTAASKRVYMEVNTATKYYLKYLNDPNHEIPTPRKRGTYSRERITQDKIEQLIRYIVDDKMTMQAASVKANMSSAATRKYYKIYLDGLKTQTQ